MSVILVSVRTLRGQQEWHFVSLDVRMGGRYANVLDLEPIGGNDGG